MAADENKEFLCTWKIKNYSFSYQRYGQGIQSPLFRASNLGGSEWNLLLYPRGYFQSDNVSCRLYRYQYNNDDESEDEIKIYLRFELGNSNDVTASVSEFQNQEIHKGAKSEEFELMKIDDLQEEMKLWTNDILILRCYLIKTHDVLPLSPNGSHFPSCEAFTEICVDTFKHTWIIRVPESPEWARKKEILFPDMLPIVINVNVYGNQIRLGICSAVKYKYPRFISCSITFLDSKGDELFSKQCARLFCAWKTDEMWEFPDFIHKSMLDLTTCIPHNDMNLKIEMSSTNDVLFSRIKYFKEDVGVGNDDKLESTQLASAEDYSTLKTDSLLRLQSHLKKMFRDSKFSDVDLISAGNKIFPVHKALLAARSPFFCGMFEQDLMKNEIGVYQMLDVEPKVLEMFLEYLYSGTISDLDDESAKDLLVVANNCEVLCLKDVCSRYLRSVLSLKNVFDVILVADVGNDVTLKSVATDYVVRNSAKVLPSPEWSIWVEQNMELASEIFFKLSQKLNNGAKI